MPNRFTRIILFVSAKQFKCLVEGCGRETTFIGPKGEEIMVPGALVGKPLERRPPFGIVFRYFLVECPEHGQQLAKTAGHHVTSVPKKSRRKER
jgi:hypothetical protein